MIHVLEGVCRIYGDSVKGNLSIKRSITVAAVPGTTNHSAVFLIELRRPQPRSAALKFISADIPAPEQRLAIWQRAGELVIQFSSRFITQDVAVRRMDLLRHHGAR